jgi:hypothetical protein
MSIVRIARHVRPFVTIDTRPLENPRLSWRAKGLLTYLISRPPDWRVQMSQLEQISADGKTGLRTIMHELRDAGHASIEQVRSTDGKHAVGTEWVIYEDPKTSDGQNPEKQETRLSGFSDSLVCGALNKTETDTDNKKDRAERAAVFVDFADDDLQAEWTAWQTYRRQAGKPLTQIGRGRQVALLSKMGVARAIAALRHSIENGWTGIFEPKNAPKPKQPWSLRERKINKLNQRKAELMRLPDSADVRRQLTQIQIQLTDL